MTLPSADLTRGRPFPSVVPPLGASGKLTGTPTEPRASPSSMITSSKSPAGCERDVRERLEEEEVAETEEEEELGDEEDEEEDLRLLL